MLNPGVFLERPSHAFWFEPCGTLIIWRSVFSTLCKVERLALDTGLQGTKCNQDIGLSHCFILNRFFHSLYVRCDVAIIFYTIKDHRDDVFFFVFILLSLTLSVKTLFFRIKQINCKSTRLLRNFLNWDLHLTSFLNFAFMHGLGHCSVRCSVVLLGLFNYMYSYVRIILLLTCISTIILHVHQSTI